MKPKPNNVKLKFVCPNRTDNSCVYYVADTNGFCRHSVYMGMETECNSSVAQVNKMYINMQQINIHSKDFMCKEHKDKISELKKHNKDLKKYLYTFKSLSFIEKIKFVFGKLEIF